MFAHANGEGAGAASDVKTDAETAGLEGDDLLHGEIHSAGGRRPAYPTMKLPPLEVEAIETIGEDFSLGASVETVEALAVVGGPADVAVRGLCPERLWI